MRHPKEIRRAAIKRRAKRDAKYAPYANPYVPKKLQNAWRAEWRRLREDRA